MLACATGLRRGREPVNLDQGAPVPCCFVVQLSHELTPSDITDRLSKLRVFDHVLDSQALNANDLVFMDNACRELMLVISSSVIDPCMDFGNFQTGFVPVLGVLLFPGMASLYFCQLLLVLLQEAGIADAFTSGKRNHRLDAQVKPDHLWGELMRLHVFFYQDGDEVAVRTIFRDRDRTRLCPLWQRSMPTDIQGLMHFCQSQCRPIPLEGIGSIGSRLLITLFLERGIVGTTFKEVDKGAIQIAKCLLQWDRRDICKPRVCFLEIRQHGSKIVVVQALAMLEIGRLACRETPIVDKADTSKRLRKADFLLIGRIEPELVCPLSLLAHSLFAFLMFLDVLSNGRQNLAIERAIILFSDCSYLLQQGSRETNGQRLYLIFHVAILTLKWLHANGIAPRPKPQTRNGAYIPVAEARGFTRRVDKCVHINNMQIGALQSEPLSATRGTDTVNTLVLLHGFTGSTSNWENLFPDLAMPGWRIVALDMLGHGRSSAPDDAERYSMEHCRSDILAVLQELGVRAGEAILLGYSMGGRIALYTAFSRFFRALLLESASPGIADPREREQRRISDNALAASIEQEGVAAFVERWEKLPLFASQSNLPVEQREILHRQRLQNRARGLANSLRGIGTGAQPALHAQLPTLDLPVLLIAGELDAKFCIIARQMARDLPHATLQIVPGAGHAVHLEQPAIFAQLVTQFCSRLL